MLRLAFMTVVLASPAWALDQGDHRDLSEEICIDAGLPDAFCRRVGAEANNVDRYEWHVMAAHGQPEPGQSTCDALQAIADRLDEVGRDVHHWIGEPASLERTHALARALGRALHTVQDNCAHEGVPNVQHAWLSLLDTCEDAHASPDARPEAMTCARAETTAVIRAFMTALGGARAGLDKAEAQSLALPPRDGLCEFLDSAKEWDGIDRGWNTWVATPMLRAKLVDAITGEDFDWTGVCDGGDAGFFKVPAPRVDVSGGPPSCKRVDAFCVGAGDAADEPPPWTTEDTAEAGGCAATGARSSWLVLVLACLLVTSGGTRRARRRGAVAMRRGCDSP